MTTIDVERLKHDLEYWNSVAPEGADAVFDLTGGRVDWYRITTREVYHKQPEAWFGSSCFDARANSMIPRPAPAWNGEGLPPVGVECEYDDCDNGWVPTVILAYHPDGHAVWHQSVKADGFSEGRSYSTDSANSFRPLKTEKDRVVEAAKKAVGAYSFANPLVQSAIRALYDAGMLKMPRGE